MNSLVEQVMFPLSNRSIFQPQRIEHHLFIRNANSKHVIMYSHGNGETLQQLHRPLQQLSDECQMSVFAYEYPGYGECIGMATSETVKAACLHACQCEDRSHSSNIRFH